MTRIQTKQQPITIIALWFNKNPKEKYVNTCLIDYLLTFFCSRQHHRYVSVYQHV